MPTAAPKQKAALQTCTKQRLEIEISDNIKSLIPSDKIDALTGILSCDPRPAYQNDSNRIYGISFDNMNVKFKVDGDKLTVLEIEK